jgi:hypothetical protein
LPVRGKAKEYTKAFEIAWKMYPRHEEKFNAFRLWGQCAKELGENELLTLIVVALNWQKKGWSKEGNKFVVYFERYLKRRKWEDEPPVVAAAAQRAPDRGIQAVDSKLAEMRAVRPLTTDQREEIRRLAESKAVG